MFGDDNGPEISGRKRSVVVYEAVNNLDKIPQPNSTANILVPERSP